MVELIIKFEVRSSVRVSMVQTLITGAVLDIWADAESSDDLIEAVEDKLSEAADSVKVREVEFEDVDSKDYHLWLAFDVRADGLFVGDRVAEELTEELEGFDKYPTVSYSQKED